MHAAIIKKGIPNDCRINSKICYQLTDEISGHEQRRSLDAYAIIRDGNYDEN